MKFNTKFTIGLIVAGISLCSNLSYGQEEAPVDREFNSQEFSDSKKAINLEDIWKKYAFYAKSVSGLRSMNDGAHYTVLENTENGKQLAKYSYKTGKLVQILINPNDLKQDGSSFSISAYEFSSNEQKVLIASNKESIYRRSWKANFIVFDLSSKELQVLHEDKVMYASFSPSGNKVAYVYNNNLFVKDFSNNKNTQISKDGEFNHIINGASDWVYEEELELSKAFEWSPDGDKIAYYRFDESKVKQWNMKMYDGLYPSTEEFKYPKAGEDNAKVSLFIFHLNKEKNVKVQITQAYEYLPAIHWTRNPNQLAVLSTNRHQNELHINLIDAQSGEGMSIHQEKSDTYIEMPFEVYFTNDGKHFVILSEKSGFRHAYLHDMKGNEVKQITKGKWPLTDFYGVDDANGLLYFQSAETSPMDRNIYSIGLDGKKKKRLSSSDGNNAAIFSKNFKFFMNYHTTANEPTTVTLHQSDGNKIRTLEDNQALRDRLSEYAISNKTFFSIKTSKGHSLNAWMIKPPQFDPAKKYPVFLTIYGGPGSQTVKNAWGGQNYFWHQMLAQKGYIVISVDNRGTGARGVDFKKITYKQLGKYETEDQIEAAKYMANLPYVDGNRIGVQGWSYGGYMSSLCLLKGAEHFKAAIAVAPVTNWRFYDSIYTERYMQTPQENEDGYDDNSPINHVDKLKGSYLLVHGSADDNVHFQNTTEMINALVKADKQFDLAVYPNKNHGIYGGNTRFHLYKKMTDFLLENL